MLLRGSNHICEAAEKYYYDFVCGERTIMIPREILRHMEKCKGCQKNVEQLKTAINLSEERDKQGNDTNAIKAHVLKLHFSFINECVTCNDVKPFLPTLLDHTTEVGIPTPITAHIEKCDACKKDLCAIRKLDLKPEQLLRLSQVFADDPAEGGIDCEDARADMLFTVLMALRETDAEVLKHVCCCVECRRLLYEHRESLRDEIVEQEVHDGLPCQDILPRDIFDYVIPYGLDPSSDQYAKFRESLTSHLRTCPKCLRKMQMLHETLYGIAEREESDIATVYHMRESSDTGITANNQDPYEYFPVTVDVIDRRYDSLGSELEEVTKSTGAGGKQHNRKVRRHLLQTAAIVVVGALVGAGLLFQGQTVQATYLDNIHDAIKQATNIHISTYLTYKEEPIQERWASQDLNLYLIKDSYGWSLSNAENKQRIFMSSKTGITKTEPIPPSTSNIIKDAITNITNLVISTHLSEINQNTPLRRIINKKLQVTGETTHIYELTVIDKQNPGPPRYDMYRFSTDRQTNLPTKVEILHKNGDMDYIPDTYYYELTYPSKEDILAEITAVMK